jgi:hypothetical protein
MAKVPFVCCLENQVAFMQGPGFDLPWGTSIDLSSDLKHDALLKDLFSAPCHDPPGLSDTGESSLHAGRVEYSYSHARTLHTKVK